MFEILYAYSVGRNYVVNFWEWPLFALVFHRVVQLTSYQCPANFVSYSMRLNVNYRMTFNCSCIEGGLNVAHPFLPTQLKAKL